MAQNKISLRDAMRMNRAQRRALGKANGGVKIPSSENIDLPVDNPFAKKPDGTK